MWRLLQIVASYGYVVTNLQNCVPECDLKSYADDQYSMIDFVAKNGDKYPVLKNANTSNVGLMGHSYGGMTNVFNAQRQDSRIKAAFHLHPCPCEALESFDHGACGDMHVDIPVAYATGSLDNVCSQVGVLDYHTHTKTSKPKFFMVRGICQITMLCAA